MAQDYGEWLKENPDQTRQQYEEYLQGLAEAARAANERFVTTDEAQVIIESTEVLMRALGHYSVEYGDQMRCRLDGALVGYFESGTSLLTLIKKAIEHEKEHRACPL